MTLRGGPADKLGNRYEKWWTVRECLHLLHGDADEIRIEPPGVEKTEFVVTVGARREFHQVKRRHPNGKWTLSELGSNKHRLLQAIGDALAGNDDRFVFVSGSEAPELTELCEAANDAESVEEFERTFLAAQGRKRSFERLLNCYWKCEAPTALDRLRRIEVHTISERDLEDQVRWGARALFLADPGKVLAELRAIVEASVHRRITRQGLADELCRRGYRMRHLRSPERAGVAVQEATDQYLAGARRRLIRQTLIPRAAAEALRSRLGETATDSVVTGKAGSGKTACVVEVTETLRERGLPVLAFRLDRIQLLSASTTTALGSHLDLEESPILVLAAAAEASDRPGVLIVDQLDAVSTMSGRNSGAFDVVKALLHEARGTRPWAVIHTIVVCRAFDWQHDHRLRQLVPPDSEAQVEVTEFDVDEVKTILNDDGFDPVLFRDRQLELLRLPQNLSLFLEAGFDTSSTPAFDTAKQIFDLYWDEKRKAIEGKVAPSPDQWKKVIETLCNEMTDTQELSVPRETLDEFPIAYVGQLASEGVLTFDGRRYGFGHESFFDYCFARVFIRRRERLAAFLKGSDQHLFRRAQVRQVLAYLRDADRTRYVEELLALLSDERIRTHIKDLVFALLAEVTDPTEEERAIWQQWIRPALKAIEDDTPNPDKLSEIAWQRFFGSPAWFEMTDRRGMIEDWLDSNNDRLVALAVIYLKRHQEHSPDRVAALLEPYADRGGEWALRLQSLMEWTDLHTSRRFFELFLHLVDNGTLDEARGPIAVNDTFWSMLYPLGKNRPEWVPEVLAHWLRRRFAVIRVADGEFRARELIGYDRSAAMLISKSAERAPAAFVKHLLPVVLGISDSASTGDESPRHDAVWTIPIKSKGPRGERACLSGLAGALATLAGESTEDLSNEIAELRRRDTYVANYLLLALYAGGAARYAHEAAVLLCDEPWRFQCGSPDNPYWYAMQAIKAVVPHCTPENRKRFETVILAYVHPDERTKGGFKRIERTRFSLLSAIPSGRRSSHANARFQELERKFGQPQGEPRRVVGPVEVESPIEKKDTDVWTDGQWLNAIQEYRSEDRMVPSGDALKGGAEELAQVLGERVKEEPERFARLALQFPADANPVYMERTLSALKDAPIASHLKLRVCRKAFTESHGVCGKSTADVLGNIEDQLPDDVVGMLDRLATEHEDPVREAWRDAGGGKPYYPGDIHSNGINTTRGRAAEAVRNLIFKEAAYVERFRQTLERMVKDRSAAVLSCVAWTLQAVASHDYTLGMSLFQKMNLSEDRLLATPHVYDFIRMGLHENFPELRPIIERMLRSSEPEVCEAGARLAGIAVLGHESAADLVGEALRGTAWHRLGVAQVASANIADPESRSWCEATLAVLFDDTDDKVRGEAASCFHQLRSETLDTYGDLIAMFCNSRAFRENSFSILHTLEESPGRLPGMTCEICENFLDRFADQARDIRTGWAIEGHTVAKLIFRTYQQHQKDEWTSRSLDLIDRLCLERIHDAGGEFEQFER